MTTGAKVTLAMDTIKMLAVILLIAFLIRNFIVQPYIIPSGSMLNTLQTGDRIFVTKYNYGIHLPFILEEVISTGMPKHGDIIVFPYPKDPSVDYIKRVIGLPGDTIEIRRQILYRNNEPVIEPYVIHSHPGGTQFVQDNMPPLVVPEGKVFVLGDNRDASRDSREWGFVDKSTIRGKAQIIFWSSVDWIKISWHRIGNLL